MTSALVVVDTDILVDAARNIRQAVDCLASMENRAQLSICVITQMELFAGCRSKMDQQRTEHFLRRFQVLKLTEGISVAAVNLFRQYRLSHGLAIPDALIAATAITLDLPFVSKNQRDYRFIAGLKLMPYPLPAVK